MPVPLILTFREVLLYVYGASAVFSLGALGWTRFQLRRWTMQQVFYVVIFLYDLCRAVFNALPFPVFGQLPIFGLFLLDVLPQLLYFSTYTLLVALWAEVYHKSHNLRVRGLRTRHTKLWFLLNTFAYGTAAAIALVIVEFGLEYSQVTLYFEGAFIAALSVSAALGFLIYGTLLYRFMKSIPKLDACKEGHWKAKLMRQVHWVTIVSTLAFIFHAIYILFINTYILVLRRSKVIEENGFAVIWFLYFILAEVCPSWIILVLLITASRSRQRAHSRRLQKASLRHLRPNIRKYDRLVDDVDRGHHSISAADFEPDLEEEPGSAAPQSALGVESTTPSMDLASQPTRASGDTRSTHTSKSKYSSQEPRWLARNSEDRELEGAEPLLHTQPEELLTRGVDPGGMMAPVRPAPPSRSTPQPGYMDGEALISRTDLQDEQDLDDDERGGFGQHRRTVEVPRILTLTGLYPPVVTVHRNDESSEDEGLDDDEFTMDFR